MIETHSKPPYPRPKSKRLVRAQAMTVSVGFRCTDGLVLAADRQMTIPNSHTFQECKIRNVSWKNGEAVWGYAANSADTSKSLSLELERHFTPDIEIKRTDIPEVFKAILSRCLSKKEIFLTLFLSRTEGEGSSLIRSYGSHITYGERCEVIGWGDSALSRFFRGLCLRARPFTVRQAMVAAIYIIKQEKLYNGQSIGGDTDVFFLEDSCPLSRLLTTPQVRELEGQLESAEANIIWRLTDITDGNMPPEEVASRFDTFNSRLESFAERIRHLMEGNEEIKRSD